MIKSKFGIFIIIIIIFTNSIMLLASKSSDDKSVVKYGRGLGHADYIEVEVTLKGKKIVKIEVTQNKDTPVMSLRAIEILTKEVLLKQTPNIDTVAGATASSRGFLEAVKSALKSN